MEGKNKKPRCLLIACSTHQRGNSQIALEYAEKGAKEKGVDIDWIILNEYFLPDGTHKNIDTILQKVKDADGIIWGTPVYFGAWTSLAQEFYEIIKKETHSLFPKVIGFVAVGAKRNGGQETTIVNAGWDLMELGACMIGDGYPLSQFGGTCVAGFIGDVENDKRGLEQSFQLGKRIAETTMIIKTGKQGGKIKTFHWSPKGKFNRCKGCPNCPDPEAHKKGSDYKCRFFDDDMFKVHKELVEADLIIPTNYDLRFHERTRYLRRDNYRLTYHIVWMPDIKYIPLFIKENSILARDKIEEYAQLISTGKKQLILDKQVYEPRGYKNPYIKK